MTGTLQVSHNMEVAHRLTSLPGKCQQIHGHSMQVHLRILGLPLNENGIAGGIDFGQLKKIFRLHLDSEYDHHLLLNMDDEWSKLDYDHYLEELPGLCKTPGDPTVENLAKWICNYMADEVYALAKTNFDIKVSIEETKTNGASWKVSVGPNGDF